MAGARLLPPLSMARGVEAHRHGPIACVLQAHRGGGPCRSMLVRLGGRDNCKSRRYSWARALCREPPRARRTQPSAARAVVVSGGLAVRGPLLPWLVGRIRAHTAGPRHCASATHGGRVGRRRTVLSCRANAR